MENEKYERKLKDMQKYVPFLESLIKNLKNGKNDKREAQLNKMETLYNILMNRDKKLNMDILHKCEIALAKLYSKVESSSTPSAVAEEDNLATIMNRSSNASSTTCTPITPSSPKSSTAPVDIQKCCQLFEYMFPNHDQSQILNKEPFVPQYKKTLPSPPPLPPFRQSDEPIPVPTISNILPELSLKDINNLIMIAKTVNSIPTSATGKSSSGDIQEIPKHSDPRTIPNPQNVSSLMVRKNNSNRFSDHISPKVSSVACNPFLDSTQTPNTIQRRNIYAEKEKPTSSICVETGTEKRTLKINDPRRMIIAPSASSSKKDVNFPTPLINLQLEPIPDLITKQFENMNFGYVGNPLHRQSVEQNNSSERKFNDSSFMISTPSVGSSEDNINYPAPLMDFGINHFQSSTTNQFDNVVENQSTASTLNYLRDVIATVIQSNSSSARPFVRRKRIRNRKGRINRSELLPKNIIQKHLPHAETRKKLVQNCPSQNHTVDQKEKTIESLAKPPAESCLDKLYRNNSDYSAVTGNMGGFKIPKIKKNAPVIRDETKQNSKEGQKISDRKAVNLKNKFVPNKINKPSTEVTEQEPNGTRKEIGNNCLDESGKNEVQLRSHEVLEKIEENNKPTKSKTVSKQDQRNSTSEKLKKNIEDDESLESITISKEDPVKNYHISENLKKKTVKEESTKSITIGKDDRMKNGQTSENLTEELVDVEYTESRTLSKEDKKKSNHTSENMKKRRCEENESIESIKISKQDPMIADQSSESLKKKTAENESSESITISKEIPVKSDQTFLQEKFTEAISSESKKVSEENSKKTNHISEILKTKSVEDESPESIIVSNTNDKCANNAKNKKEQASNTKTKEVSKFEGKPEKLQPQVEGNRVYEETEKKIVKPAIANDRSKSLKCIKKEIYEKEDESNKKVKESCDTQKLLKSIKMDPKSIENVSQEIANQIEHESESLDSKKIDTEMEDDDHKNVKDELNIKTDKKLRNTRKRKSKIKCDQLSVKIEKIEHAQLGLETETQMKENLEFVESASQHSKEFDEQLADDASQPNDSTVQLGLGAPAIIPESESLHNNDSNARPFSNSDILLENILNEPRRKRLSNSFSNNAPYIAVKKLKLPSSPSKVPKQSTAPESSDGSQEFAISSTTAATEDVDMAVNKEPLKEVVEENIFEPAEAGRSNKSEITKDDLMNFLKPDKTTAVLGMLEKLLNQDKFNQIKTILNSNEVPEVPCEDATDVVAKLKPKPASARKKTELDRLNEDLRDMFIRDGVLSATGPRICKAINDRYIDEIEIENAPIKMPHKPKPKCKATARKPKTVPKDNNEEERRKEEIKGNVGFEEDEVELIFHIEVGQNVPVFNADENQLSIKNVNPEMHSQGKYCKSCVLCGISTRYLAHHYVTVHKTEVFISRLPPAALERLQEYEGYHAVQTTSNTLFCAMCPFCDTQFTFNKNQWLNHFATHTGEYPGKCSACGFARNKVSAVRLHIENECPTANLISMRAPMEDKDIFFAYVCDLCHYVQMNSKNVIDHLHTQHNSSKESITKIILLNFKQDEMIRGEYLSPPVLDIEVPVKECEEVPKLETAFITKEVVVRLKRLKNSTIKKATRVQPRATKTIISTKHITEDDSSKPEIIKNIELKMNVKSPNTAVVEFEDKPIKTETVFAETVIDISHAENSNAVGNFNRKCFKNIHPEMHVRSKYAGGCLLCPSKTRFVSPHYINIHKCEVLVSRLPPEKQEELLHNNLATDAKPSVCPFCYISVRFRDKRDWVSHITTHTGEYKHKCSKCSSVFSTLAAITRHTTITCPNAEVVRNQLIVPGDVIFGFICDLCNYLQLNKQSVIEHLATQHNCTDELIQKVNLVNLDRNLGTANTANNVTVENENHDLFEDDEIELQIFKEEDKSSTSETTDLQDEESNVAEKDLNMKIVENVVNSDSRPTNVIGYWDTPSTTWLQKLLTQQPKTPNFQNTVQTNEILTNSCVGQGNNVANDSVIDMPYNVELEVANCFEQKNLNSKDEKKKPDETHSDVSKVTIFMSEENISNSKNDIKESADDVIVLSDDDDTQVKSRGMFYSDSDHELEIVCENGDDDDWEDIEVEPNGTVLKKTKETYSTLDRLYASIMDSKLEKIIDPSNKIASGGKKSVTATITTNNAVEFLDHADRLPCNNEKKSRDSVIVVNQKQKHDIETIKPLLKIRHLPGDSLSVTSRTMKPPIETQNQPLALHISNVVSLSRSIPDNLPKKIVEVNTRTLVPPLPRIGNLTSIKQITSANASCPTNDGYKASPVLDFSNAFRVVKSPNKVATISTGKIIIGQVQLPSTRGDSNMASTSIPRQINFENRSSAKEITSVTKTYGSVSTATQSPLNIRLSNAVGNKIGSVLKPWTFSKSNKSAAIIEQLLHKNNLVALCKCMGNDCDFTTNFYSIMIKHLNHHSKLNMFYSGNRNSYEWLECSYCSNMWTTDATSLVSHIRETHFSDIYQCPYCFYRSCDGFNVTVHSQQYHPDKEISVYVCAGKKVSVQKELLIAENRMKRNCKEIQCSECPMFFMNPSDFANHLILHKPIIPDREMYICALCTPPNNFIPKKLAVKHLMSIHNIAAFQCIYCLFATDEKLSYNRHMANCHASNFRFCLIRSFMNQSWESREFDIYKSYNNKTALGVLKGSVNKECMRVMQATDTNPRNQTAMKSLILPFNDRIDKIIMRREIIPQTFVTKPHFMDSLPTQPIFATQQFCAICGYGTKVRTNFIRHMQQHDLSETTVSRIDPVNPVPCLNTGEKHFDKMLNLACSSNISK